MTDRQPALVGVIMPERPKTCGNCEFSKLVQLGVVECWGLPPTPVAFGGRQNLAGQVEMQIELLRPRLPANQARCALWSEKVAQTLDERQMQGAA